ncbi:nucleolar protein gar2 [Forsythia ovata]|uniref:Nucleolar protein gar2 n=1 Tax=Forsythia ovata TaxID=205694 RepID=A0ABD1S6C8_9LAMI
MVVVVIQWEHGDRNSGCTNQVAISLGTGSGVGDERIEFSESFRLPVTLLREMSIKGAEGNTFQKNCVEFNLYEPRRDKTVKGQLLETAILDLADYGVVKESLSVNAPINCKRTYRNTAQPLLFLKIQPF